MEPMNHTTCDLPQVSIEPLPGKTTMNTSYNPDDNITQCQRLCPEFCINPATYYLQGPKFDIKRYAFVSTVVA